MSIVAFLLITLFYAAAQLAHASLRLSNAVAYLRTTPERAGRAMARPPSVDVLVPCYNERADLLNACLTSLTTEQYEGRLRVFVVDDGSKNRTALRPVFDAHPECEFLLLDENVGKRRALDAIVWRGTAEIVVTVDSDTTIEPGAISRIVRPFEDREVGAACGQLHPSNKPTRQLLGLLTRMLARMAKHEYRRMLERARAAISRIVRPFEDREVGAACGQLHPSNKPTLLPGLLTNLLTKMLTWVLTTMAEHEYWRMFERARAAQSQFGTVFCCSGGFSAYRRSALRQVWGQHVNQVHAGRRIKGGDDLHLTLLILDSGHRTVYQPDAVALTRIPETLTMYARQQYRWSRSFVREFKFASDVARRGPAYPRFDLIAQATIPPTMTVIVLAYLVGGLFVDRALFAHAVGPVLLAVAALLAAMGLQVRSVSGMLHGSMHLALVLPFRIIAIASRRRDTWKTRDLPEPGDGPVSDRPGCEADGDAAADGGDPLDHGVPVPVSPLTTT